MSAPPGVGTVASAQVILSAVAAGVTACKTVGSAYVGSNPTPAARRNTSSGMLWRLWFGVGPCSHMPPEAAVCARAGILVSCPAGLTIDAPTSHYLALRGSLRVLRKSCSGQALLAEDIRTCTR